MKLTLHKNFIPALFFCLLYIPQSRAQNAAKNDVIVKKATEDFNDYKYVAVIERLSPLIQKDTNNLRAKEMLAYSYKMTNNYPQALKWYQELVRQPAIKADWALNYAEQLGIDQQYEKSENWYRKYLALIPSDKRAANFAKLKVNELENNAELWKVGFTNLNTIAAEYSPIFYNEGLIFSSNRQAGKFIKHIFEWDNTPFTNLFVVSDLKNIKEISADSLSKSKAPQSQRKTRLNDDDTAPTSNDTRTLGQYAHGTTLSEAGLKAKELSISKLLGGKINSKYHNASAAVFPDGSIIFTRNNYNKGQIQKSTDDIVKLKLYTASGEHLTKITEFPYNSNEYSTGHPALNKEGNILVFASDMPGGYGGTDLYYSVRSGKGPWTKPVNLGKKINTEGNEMFPYLDKSGNLYFSSNGHAGLGGLDIFEVPLKEMKPTAMPKNMAAPINSSTDDFGFIIADDGKSGYFSSNRKGNDDIYQFNRTSTYILLKGIVYDANTRIPLSNSRLVMQHSTGTDTLKTNVNGEYQRVLPAGMEYQLTAKKTGYVNNISYLSSMGITGDTTLIKNLYLSKAENAQQYVINNCDSLKKVFAVDNIYYDLDRADIRPDARPALDALARLMINHPEMSVISSSHTDSRATNQYNKNLSLRRGEAAKAYLIKKGISPSRIAIEYYGKSRLVNRCYEGVPCSEADQQLNRRTEFDVIVNGVNLTRQNCGTD